ncbi:MAG: adenylyltransferase/cytidyltransferase family protein [Candidatus Pacebacteria bacterium]|nr:adenylyltransferase/cytidyltransferase family protein [Candidatus Paceibacterota bacterium]
MLISSEAAVLLTITYSDQFKFPLTKKEIAQRLIKISVTENKLGETLINLSKLNLIENKGGFWKLSKGTDQVKNRLRRANYSQQKWLEVDKLLSVIGWIPWIRGVAVTGSLAVDNVTVNDDIDLMLVVAPQRLWLSRVLVSLSSLWVGKRRTWQGNEENSWCFNLWLDDKHLGLPKNKRNLYSAYEVCQTKWMLDKAGIEKKFYQNNYWVKNLLPNYFNSKLIGASKIIEAEKSGYESAPILRFIGRKILSILDFLTFSIQYFYMYSHMSREKVSLSNAYFHPRSTKGQIYEKWFSSLKQIQSQDRRVVLVTGVFDLFHQEHQNFLRKAKLEGDLLVVGIETDDRVKKNKGLSRPIDDQQKRLQQLQLFPVVDLAFILPEKFDTAQEHLALLKLIKPQVLAVSSHTPYLEEKQRLMKKVGGEARVVYRQNPDISTTRLTKLT